MSASIELPLSRALDEVQSVVLDRFRKYGERNISNSPGGPLNGLRVRLHDKLARLNNAVDSGNTDFDDDSFRDCFIDVVGYGLIGLLVVDGDWPSDQKPEKPLADLVDREQVARVLLAAPGHQLVHDHGIDPSCRERVVDGALRGECVAPRSRTTRWSSLAKAEPGEPDSWPVGTTFKPDFGDWTWRLGADGWAPTSLHAQIALHKNYPTLRAVISSYYPAGDGVVTEPIDTLQKEAA